MKKNIYLDYSATTPVNKKVLKQFYKDNITLVGNSNSIHKLGRICKEQIDETSKRILKVLGLENDYEVIYTSGASEANNLAIKGLANKYKKGRIITTYFEHSSIIAPLGYLQRKGFEVVFVDCDENGQIDLNDLKKLMNDDVILVSIAIVNSEIGIYQPIEDIKKIVHSYSNAILHIDMTQCIGKISVNLKDIDMLSYSAHKIYGLKGIGALIKKKSIKLEAQIQGGNSTTKYRSGTPMHPLILSLGNSTYFSLQDIEKRYIKVKKLHDYFLQKIANIKNVIINSNDKCIPHIINISFLGKQSKDVVLELEKNNIFISNHSACSSDELLSKSVFSLTKNEEIAKSSVRFSVSYLTTKKELDTVIKVLEKIL